jgi:hypothetical protein
VSKVIGKTVKSNSHTDYVCQVYGAGEIEASPLPADHAFGTFVNISLGEGASNVVGLVYDTILLNPEFGNLGPRLSSEPDLAIFAPDYLSEKVTLVGIAAIGIISPDGTAVHGVPPVAAQTDALVECMDDGAIQNFHRPVDSSQVVQMGYAPLIMSLGSPLARHLLLKVVDRLTILFPEQSTRLSVLRGELAWQAIIGPVGGTR